MTVKITEKLVIAQGADPVPSPFGSGADTAAPVPSPFAAPSRPAPSRQPLSAPRTSVPGGAPMTYQPGPAGSVKAMQQAILDFGNTLAQNYLMETEEMTHPGKRAPGGELQLQHPFNVVAPSPQAPGGSDAFGNFLVKHYLNNEKVVGKQFVNVNLPDPLQASTALKPNISLRGVVNTIQRVGSPGADHKPDGVWMSRTDNALKQIAAVGRTLLQLQKDLKLEIPGYTEQDARQLESQIPKSYTELGNTAAEKAALITPNLQKLNSFYQNFEKTFLNNPEYRAIITQAKPLASHEAQVQLTKSEQDFMQRYGVVPIPGVFSPGKSPQPVSLQYLTSPEHFQQLLESSGVLNPQDHQTQLRALETIKKQLATVPTSEVK